MKRSLFVFALAAGASFVTSAGQAGSLPAVKASTANQVPACATPGRMMAYLASRNGDLDKRFIGIATAYMRHGEQLGVRWDYAFYQMIYETGALSFRRGDGKPGLVRASQNNFAGLGATGRGVHGEEFASVGDGVKAHLQHLLMYAGENIQDAVADRTRKVQSWGILTSWQKQFKRPISYSDIAAKWAPGVRRYGRDIEAIAETFREDFCNKPDPQPELVAEARGTAAAVAAASTPAAPASDETRVDGRDLARQALERGRQERGEMSALGARVEGVATPPKVDTASLTILNEPKADAGLTEATPGAGEAKVQVASAAAAAKTAAPQLKPSEAGKCRVWTASYGGSKSVIIRSTKEKLTNFTVLDVNEGQEARETEAYIAAYAKGGSKIGEFPSQTTALSKAFELCPEG